MSKLYGWGASVVILGALFKINHYQGANLMLIIGLGTESLIFFFSAFEPPHVEPDWSLVYPELAGMYHSDAEIQQIKKGDVVHELDNMLEEAKIGPELIESLGNGFRRLSENTEKMVQMSDSAAATDEYVEKLRDAATSAGDLSDSYKRTAEALNQDINLSEEYLQNIKNASESVAQLSDIYNQTSEAIKVDSNTYNDQLQKVSSNLSALNAVYELQLQSTNEQLESSNRMQDGISQFIANINDSVENTNLYKEQLEALTKNISALNSVYGNMLSAMNVGIGQ
ncbi:gliding motility protein GldL [candidate division KSB1 bacterium]